MATRLGTAASQADDEMANAHPRAGHSRVRNAHRTPNPPRALHGRHSARRDHADNSAQPDRPDPRHRGDVMTDNTIVKVSFNCGARALASLELAAQKTGDNHTDVLNRALQLYAWVSTMGTEADTAYYQLDLGLGKHVDITTVRVESQPAPPNR